ncbi:MAG TPA: SDR family oxidoreductase [Myxococcales bacterium]|nr:SDR family oxidoreductase [Myxococcales bacterium]
MKVCVTGAAGFIGGHIAEALLADGDEVTGLDDFSSGKRENASLLAQNPRFSLVEGTIADSRDVEKAVAGATWVFHLAAIPSVPVSMNEPERTTAVNVGGTVNVLEAARNAGVQRVVLACSCAAYGDGPEQPKHELLQPRPMSPYAAQKIACELLAQTWTRAYGLPCVALRFFNVYGPRQDPKSEYAAAIPRFTTRLLAGQPPIVFGDGLQTRDFVHVSDVVRANLLAARSDQAPGEVINVASGRSSSLIDLIALLKTIIGSDALIEHEGPRAGDLRESSANIDKARTLLGYEPRVSLEQGLKGVVDFFRGNRSAPGRPAATAS